MTLTSARYKLYKPNASCLEITLLLSPFWILEEKSIHMIALRSQICLKQLFQEITFPSPF